MPTRRPRPKHPVQAPAAPAPAAPARAERKRWAWLAAAGIVLAGAAAYYDSLQGQLFYDDTAAVIDNPTIRSLWPPWGCLLPPPDTTVSVRPFVNFTLAINYALGGERLLGYHLLNLVIHVLAGLAFFGIVRRTLAGLGAVVCGPGCRGSRRRLTQTTRTSHAAQDVVSRTNGGKPQHSAVDHGICPHSGQTTAPSGLSHYATPLAMIAALMWVLHPIQTESVSYLIQRVESLMGLMYLLTLYCAVRGFQGGGRGWYAAATACCALGMASKEVMVTAPILVLLYDRALVAGTFRDALRRRWGVYLALAGTWAVLAACMYTGTRAQSVGFNLGISGLDYLKTQAGVLLQYLRVSLWPDELVFDYYWQVAREPRQWVPQGIAILLLLAATGVGVWRNRPWGFLGAWFFLILGPTSSFIPIATEIAAEHRMYLPLAALVCGAVVGAFHYGGRLARPDSATPAARRGLAATGILAALAAILTLGILTFERNQDYYTTKNIWVDTVLKQPGNPRALVNLGAELEHKNDFDGALAYYQAAKAADANYGLAMSNAGSLLVRMHRPQDALPYLHDVLRLRPDSAAAHNNLGVALMAMGKYDEAIAPLRTAADLDANRFEFRGHLAEAMTNLRRFDEAQREYARAIQQAPKEAVLYVGLGKALEEAGRFAEAADQYRAALRLDPSLPQALSGLAGLLATCPDDRVRNGREAVTLAQRLCGLPKSNTSENLGILAAAYAEAGNFEQAVETIQRVLTAAIGQPQDVQDAFRKQLETYRAGRAMRTPATRSLTTETQSTRRG